MAQRISRAKRTVADVRFDQPGDLGDRAAGALPGLQRGLHRRRRLAAEAIRLNRQLASRTDDEETGGCWR
jgi:predicted RNA polymerase sigma factor